MVFGFNANRSRNNLPMEIELKQFSLKSSVNHDRSPERASNPYDSDEECENRGEMPSASISHRTIERIASELAINVRHSLATHSLTHSPILLSAGSE